MSKPEVLIIAAEASSSLYAQRLLEYWQANGTDVHAFGIGSRAMESLGFEILGRSEELAVVGLQEVLAHFPLIKKTFENLVEQAASRKPKFALLLDYPDFNLRLAAKLKKLGIPVVYYISPQVWAWRTGRVNTIRKIVDRMLVLFPFEEDFYRAHGVASDFVGHPLLDELDSHDQSDRAERRHRFAIEDGDTVLGLMPGSRTSEIKHHLRAQLEATKILMQRQPRVRPLLFIAPTLERDQLTEILNEYDLPVQVVKDEPTRMIQLADIVLCASGTATLLVGLMEKPMVIMYRMNAITAFFAKRLVNKTPFFGLVNLIMRDRVVPELFQEQANPKRMADELEKYMLDQTYRNSVVSRLRDLKNRLGAKGATVTVAGILKSYLVHPDS